MSKLNVIRYAILTTQFCVIVAVIETLILCNSNLLKILSSNYISNYTRAYLWTVL